MSDSYSDLVDHLNGGQALFPARSVHAVLVLARKHKRGAAENSISMVSNRSLSWRVKAVLKCAATAQNLPMRSRTIILISGGQEVPWKLHREVVFPTLKVDGQEDVFDDYTLFEISRGLAQYDFYLLRLETAKFVERLVGFGVIGP